MQELYLEQLKEAIFISKSPLVYKLDEWEKNINGKLFVTGVVGSGKSVYANELSKKYRCKVIELDRLLMMEIIPNYLKKHPDVVKNVKFYDDRVGDSFYQILGMKEKLICEGLHVIWMPRKELFDKCSVILIRTSGMLSIWRSFRRNIEKLKDEPYWRNKPGNYYWNIFKSILKNRNWRDLNQFEIDLQSQIKK